MPSPLPQCWERFTFVQFLTMVYNFLNFISKSLTSLWFIRYANEHKIQYTLSVCMSDQPTSAKLYISTLSTLPHFQMSVFKENNSINLPTCSILTVILQIIHKTLPYESWNSFIMLHPLIIYFPLKAITYMSETFNLQIRHIQMICCDKRFANL